MYSFTKYFKLMACLNGNSLQNLHREVILPCKPSLQYIIIMMQKLIICNQSMPSVIRHTKKHKYTVSLMSLIF